MTFNTIKVIAEPYGRSTIVRGYLGTQEIVSLNNSLGGDWIVGGSTCLPSDLKRAALCLEVMQRTFAKAKEYGATF